MYGSSGIGRIVSLENALINAVVNNGDALLEAMEFLSSDEFLSPHNARIFSIITRLYNETGIVDTNKIGYELVDSDGAHFDHIIFHVAGEQHSVSYYIKEIKDACLGRKMFALGNRVMQMAVDEEVTGEDILGQTEELLIRIVDEQLHDDFISMPELLDEVYMLCDKRFNARDNDMPKYGLSTLDDMTLGIPKKNLTIVAGRPSHGKTEFAIQAAMYNACVRDIPVAIFSLEMTREQIIERMLSNMTGVGLYEFRSGKISKKWETIKPQIEKLKKAPLFVEDKAVDLQEIMARIRKIKLKHKNLGVVIIDYIQLINDRKPNGSREQEIGRISRTLKNLAMNLDIAVIGISQLSRACESRSDRRPILSDLRDSGTIEQDADTVIFMYRPYCYSKETEDITRMEVVVGKQRNGPIGTIEMHNEVSIQTITEAF